MQRPFFIPGWKIVGIIGGGSFGSVYEIKRVLPNIQECAALKVISIPEEDIYSIDAVGERDRTARGSDRKTGERSMSSFGTLREAQHSASGYQASEYFCFAKL